ncbi:MAG: hypothetical protein U0359_16720 [Byssovorax sp.]
MGLIDARRMTRLALCAAALLAGCSSVATPAPVEIAPSTVEPAQEAQHTTAMPGDRCATTFACSADGRTFLRCDGGQMTFVSRCRGPRGCRIDAAMIHCDQTIAEIGDACTGTGAACALDGLNLLECRGGRFTLRSACTGGCEAGGRKRISCYGEGLPP